MRIAQSAKHAILLCLIASAVQVVGAAPITGKFNLGGTVTISSAGLDFLPPAGDGTGILTTLPGGNTGTFLTLNSGFTGATIVDRDEALHPAGEPINVPNFIQLSALPAISFELLFIQPGGYLPDDCAAAPANGQTCTPAPFDPDNGGPLTSRPSAYNFANYIDSAAGLSSTATFSVLGIGMLGGDATPFRGTFNMTFLGQPYQNTLALMAAGGTTVPFSATFDFNPIPNDEVPEPGAASLLGVGGLVLGSVRYLRNRGKK